MYRFKFKLLIVVFSLCCLKLAAQHVNIHNPITLPDKSQESTIIQKIGYTEIKINYHSPGVKSRKVWGDLIPFNKVWRAGANENTVFSVSDDVKIEGKTLPAGRYGLHLLPEESQWTFIFSKNHTSWGSYFYQEDEDELRVTVPVEKSAELKEWMSFDFITRDRDKASIVLHWADRLATFNLTLDINKIALDNIRNQLRSDAYWEWFSWCQAADYCAEYKINTSEALEWINKSIEIEENFSNWDVKSKLLKQLGEEAAAEKAIEKAMEVGSAVFLERYGRRLFKEEKFSESVYAFDQALKKNDSYWRAHYNKGRCLVALGKKEEAKKAFRVALKLAPDSKKAEVQSSLNTVQ